MKTLLGALLVLGLLQAAMAGDATAKPETPATAGNDTAGASPACGDHSDCRACILDTGCGWCSITGECVEGTVTGPNAANCSVWDYAFCTGEPCSSYKTCHDCLKDSFCGWCDSLAADKPGDSKCTEGNWQGSIFGSCAKDSWHKASCPPNKEPAEDAKTTLGHGDPNVKNGPMPEAAATAEGAKEAPKTEEAPKAEEAKASASAGSAVASAVASTKTAAYSAVGGAAKAASYTPAAAPSAAPSSMHVASSSAFATVSGSVKMDEGSDAVPPSAPAVSMDEAPVAAKLPKEMNQGPPTEVQLDEEIANAVPIPTDAAGTMIEMQEERKEQNTEDAMLDSDDQQFS